MNAQDSLSKVNKSNSEMLCWDFWQDLLIRHVLDPMHCENVMKAIWGVHDTLKARLDLKEAKIRPHLHLLPRRIPGYVILPTTPYIKRGEGQIHRHYPQFEDSYKLR